MDLYFLRHGIAVAAEEDPARDHERPLTSEGIRKVEAEAKYLKSLAIPLDVILTSPLVRSRQTAEIVARRLDVPMVEDEALAPGFDAAAAAKIVARYPAANALMLVGHEPDFSVTIGAIIGGGRVVMKKGGLARVQIERASRRALVGTLVWLLPPKTLA